MSHSFQILFLLLFSYVRSCTNLIATKSTTATGCNMFTYNDDSSSRFGELYHYPAATHADGEMRQVYDWGSNEYLGQIPEVNETYNVIGNMNEYGLAIGETTWEGREELYGDTVGAQKGYNNTILDYGSLIYISLQRCKTPKEAIKTIVNLSNLYGYYSEGESFTIANGDEVWVLDLIGRGNNTNYSDPDEPKVCWVARHIPDGYISGHANQCRMPTIEDFDAEQDDNEYMWDTTMWDFAVKMGYITDVSSSEDSSTEGSSSSATKRSFDFIEVFNPIDFSGARFCDGRVYTYFRRCGVDGIDNYTDYITGANLSHRFDLWYKPNSTLITMEAMEQAISDHFEGTVLDMTVDLGAGPWAWGNRHHPLYWYADYNGSTGVQFHHERPIATQQTGWSFIAMCRPQNETYPISGLLYFGVDDAATSVHVPFYPGMQRLPWNWETSAYTSGVDHPHYCMNYFSYDSMFWVSTMVSNFAYTDFTHIYPAVQARRHDLNMYFEAAVNVTDEEVRRIFAEESNETLARQKAHEYVTNVCVEWGAMAHDEWLALYDSLFLEYSDLVQRTPVESERDPTVTSLKYSDTWYKYIVKYTGTHYSTDQLTSSSSSSDASTHTSTRTNSHAVHHHDGYVHPSER